MENFFNLVVVMISIYGWYILIKDILDNYIYRNVEIDDDIKLQIIVKNKQDKIEMIIKKILHAQSKIGYFKKIEILDENSADQTYEILKKLEAEHNNIKVRRIL